jgi:hypothetical protein
MSRNGLAMIVVGLSMVLEQWCDGVARLSAILFSAAAAFA